MAAILTQPKLSLRAQRFFEQYEGAFTEEEVATVANYENYSTATKENFAKPIMYEFLDWARERNWLRLNRENAEYDV